MKKEALLAVSFGTSHQDTLEKTITAIEDDLKVAFPEKSLYRAFTSGMILRVLEVRGIQIDDVKTALEKLIQAQYTHVLIQPTHIMNGDEYDKLCRQAREFQGQFTEFKIGTPLLTAVEDYKKTAEALVAILPQQMADTAIIFMGHGTTHHANSAYTMLEYVLHDMGRTDILIGTVEGYPALSEVINRLKERGDVTKLSLYPLMIVAGDHAKNDLAGDEDDAWRSQLTALGYEVTCTLMGLGEYAGIRQIFVNHAENA